MKIRQKTPFQHGYHAICRMDEDPLGMLLDIGALQLNKDDQYTLAESHKEMALLLVKGEAELSWNGRCEFTSRHSFIEDNPWCLHVPAGVSINVLSKGDSEWIVQKTTQDNAFDPVLYAPSECRSEIFGAGVQDDTSKRTVRTIFDFQNAPYSNMVMGEVINHAGRWSSYPPHDHEQPEVYHYRFEKEQGFGIAVVEDDAFVVRSRDTLCIPGGKVHPQVAAPGYPMWYCWMIRHLPGNPFTERCFREEHKWLL